MTDKLIFIGEKINHSIPRAGRLLDAGDYPAIQQIARRQVDQGADYIDVNVGPLSPEVMKAAVTAVSEVVEVPLCIDSTDPGMLEAGLSACAALEAGPGTILNSALESNAESVLGLRRLGRCQVVLLVSERLEKGVLRRNTSAEEAHGTAKRLFSKARENGFLPEEIYVDPGTPPIASDLEGLSNQVLRTIESVHRDPDMQGTHLLVGISNFTAGLPRGLRLPLQSAFLTRAVALGLDTVIGDPGKKYRNMDSADPFLGLLDRIMSAQGAERIALLVSSPLYGEAVSADSRSNSSRTGEHAPGGPN
jgi:cobalamin-dependent methionine synthase I